MEPATEAEEDRPADLSVSCFHIRFQRVDGSIRLRAVHSANFDYAERSSFERSR